MRSFSRSFTVLLSLFAAGGAQACGSFTTAYRFDLARQVVGVISPADGAGREAVRNTYDSEGRITKIERGVLTACPSEDVLPRDWQGFDVRHVVEKAYDVMGRLLSEKRSGPTLTQHSYDTVGRLECTAVRMNSAVYNSIATLSACQLSAQGSQGPDRITRFLYDVAGRVVTEQRAYGTSIQQNYSTYGYTPNGLQDWVDDANGNRTDFTYDGFDRLGRMNFPRDAVGARDASLTDYEAYGYDNNSNLISKRLRSEEIITYGFDALNRLELKNLAGTGSVSYTYDNFGLNETAQISGGAGISNTYDGFGRLTQATSTSSAGSLMLGYSYDEDGNRTRVTWPDGTYVQYTYDGRNRMKQVRENNAVSGPGLLADYSYDVFGRRTNLVRGNGATTAYDYDLAWRLSSLSQDLASASQDLSLGFSYNSASQVAGRTVSNEAYSYFSMTQSKSYSRDGRNRYTTVGGINYVYDGRGNLKSDGARTFNYDLENHLLSVTGSEKPVSLTYDPNGRLLTSTSGGLTTRYLYDGDKLVAEYNGATLVRRYVHGAGVDEPLVWYEGAGLTDRRWLHADHQGSVVANSNGTGVGTVYAYSAYGEPAYGNWGGSRFRYTGQIMLPEAKLYHYKARVYDPVLGRFLQTDPVGYKDDFNLYAYVRNDPLNKTDPTGLAEYSFGFDVQLYLGAGGKLGGAVTFDTETLEVGAKGSAALGGGLSAGVGIIAERGPSSTSPASSSTTKSMSITFSANAGPVGVKKEVPVTENGSSVIGQSNKTSGSLTGEIEAPAVAKIKPEAKIGADVSIEWTTKKTSDAIPRSISEINRAMDNIIRKASCPRNGARGNCEP
ncbi:RHS repeat domain-containing protein [Steroidobacter cummioxidans]|uniref:RHS repeat domain-containing protein n=1 Tax=Steroidobacter cummioxidans TaxID=1803913 RepID=UPI00137B3D41|nr:RHS repeat-associated core domain-containing protein [Steroidobacter cummioxidans]